MMDKVREALDRAIKDMDRVDEVCEMAGVHPFDLMRLRSDLQQALSALTQPQPEAREEDIERAFRDFSENGPVPETLMPMIERVANELGGFHISVDAMRLAGVNFAAGWLSALSRLAAKEGQSQAQQARIENLRESLVIADARMTKQLSGKLMSVTLIGYLSQIQQDIRAAIKADNEAAASATPERPEHIVDANKTIHGESDK